MAHLLPQCILSASQYFEVMMRESWGADDLSVPSGGGHNTWSDKAPCHFELDLDSGSPNLAGVTEEQVLACIQFLYGIPPAFSEADTPGLLLAASFLDLPHLVSAAADWQYHNMSRGGILPALNFVSQHELGAAGELVRGAAEALLRRDPAAVMPQLADTSLSLMCEPLLSPEAFYTSEAKRWDIVSSCHASCLRRLASATDATQDWSSAVDLLGQEFAPFAMDVPATLQALRQCGWGVALPFAALDVLHMYATVKAGVETRSFVEGSRHRQGRQQERVTRHSEGGSSPHVSCAHNFSWEHSPTPPAKQGSLESIWGPLGASSSTLSALFGDWQATLQLAAQQWQAILAALEQKRQLPPNLLACPLVQGSLQLQEAMLSSPENPVVEQFLRKLVARRPSAEATLKRVVAWQVLQGAGSGCVELHNTQSPTTRTHEGSIVSPVAGSPGRERGSRCGAEGQALPGRTVQASGSARAGGRLQVAVPSTCSPKHVGGGASVCLFSPLASKGPDGSWQREPVDKPWRARFLTCPLWNVPAARDVIDCIFEEAVFQTRFMHMSKLDLDEIERLGESQQHREHAVRDGLQTGKKLREARWLQLVLRSQVEEAVRREESSLQALRGDPALPLAVRCQRMPSLRAGFSVEGALASELSPFHHGGAAQTISSNSLIFMGSKWRLDLKRFLDEEGGGEMLAVYLRRLAASPEEVQQHAGSSAAFVDSRSSVCVSFSIRLCGGPGTPTLSSIRGSCSGGKLFGTLASQSWGWDTFLSLNTLAPKPWKFGDALHFMVTITPV